MSEMAAKLWKTILTASTLAVLALIPLRILFGMDLEKLGAAHFGLIAVAIGGMLLLPVVDRLIELRLSPTGLSATLDQIKEEAEAKIVEAAGPAVAAAIRPQLELAQTPEAVEVIKELAVSLKDLRLNVAQNLDKLTHAIRDRRAVFLSYVAEGDRVPSEFRGYPLDIKMGRTPKVADQDYLLIFDPAENKPKTPKLSGIRRVDVLEEVFDPAPIIATFKEAPTWNLPRDW